MFLPPPEDYTVLMLLLYLSGRREKIIRVLLVA